MTCVTMMTLSNIPTFVTTLYTEGRKRCLNRLKENVLVIAYLCYASVKYSVINQLV